MALAEAVIATAKDAARERGLGRITRMDVAIGALQSIDVPTFRFLLEELIGSSEPALKSARLEVEAEPARFRCRPCGHTFGLGGETAPQGEDESEAIHFVPELAHAFLVCPGCGSPDFEIVSGRGVTIAVLDGE